jgi:hypothetical protein
VRQLTSYTIGDKTMKRMLIVMAIAIAASFVTLGQTKTPKNNNNSVEAQLIALEKQAWEAWKNRDGSFYQSLLSEDVVGVGSQGIFNKSQTVKAISTSTCEVKSYSLDNFKLVMLDKNTAVLTYKGTQDATCDGKAEPPTVWASTVFVKRGGKWLAAFHQETPVVQ